MADKAVTRSYWIDRLARDIGVKFQVAIIDGVTIKKNDYHLTQSISSTVRLLQNVVVETEPIIEAYREIFATIGVKSFISSPELLLRYIKRSKRLPNINTVVDAYNEKSAERFIVASAHDLAKIVGDVRIVMTKGGETFYPLGSAEPEILPAGEWAGVDDAHVLCRMNCKQSELSKVTLNTTALLIYVQGNAATTETYVTDCLKEICEYIIRFNGGKYYLLYEYT